jgi:hypothetical protein
MEQITCSFCGCPFPVETSWKLQKCPECGSTNDVQDRLDSFYTMEDLRG